jgi:MFS family permease
VAEVLPWLLTALPAGAIVDRVQPRQVVVVAHLLRAVLTGGLVAAIVTGHASVPLICAFALALTTAETFAYPASQVLMVELAGPEKLHEANSKFFTVQAVGLYLAGPLAAGALFALGPALAFAVDGVSFVVAAALIVGLPNFAPKVIPGQAGRPKLLGEVGEGLRLLAGNSGLRTLVSLVSAATIAIAAVNALTPLYAVQDLGMRPSFVASLLIIGSLGTLIASRVVVPLVRKWSDGLLLIASMALIASGMVVFGAIRLVVAALVANALIGVGVGAFNVLGAARRQRLTPPHAMGRVSGAYRGGQLARLGVRGRRLPGAGGAGRAGPATAAHRGRGARAAVGRRSRRADRQHSGQHSGQHDGQHGRQHGRQRGRGGRRRRAAGGPGRAARRGSRRARRARRRSGGQVAPEQVLTVQPVVSSSPVGWWRI